MRRYRLSYRWRSSHFWDTATIRAESQRDAEQKAFDYLFELYMPDKLICLRAVRG